MASHIFLTLLLLVGFLIVPLFHLEWQANEPVDTYRARTTIEPWTLILEPGSTAWCVIWKSFKNFSTNPEDVCDQF